MHLPSVNVYLLARFKLTHYQWRLQRRAAAGPRTTPQSSSRPDHGSSETSATRRQRRRLYVHLSVRDACAAVEQFRALGCADLAQSCRQWSFHPEVICLDVSAVRSLPETHWRRFATPWALTSAT